MRHLATIVAVEQTRRYFPVVAAGHLALCSIIGLIHHNVDSHTRSITLCAKGYQEPQQCWHPEEPHSLLFLNLLG